MAIIVGDIHGDIEKAQAFLAYRPDALHIALGDYLDSYTVPFLQQVECLNLLMDSSAVLLLGIFSSRVVVESPEIPTWLGCTGSCQGTWLFNFRFNQGAENQPHIME